jgi:hypothetical protein
MNVNIYMCRYNGGTGKFPIAEVRGQIAEVDSEAEVYTFAI